MIISASYKTDIPTFYGDWFVNRLRAGYCKTLNPYNRQIVRDARNNCCSKGIPANMFPVAWRRRSLSFGDR